MVYPLREDSKVRHSPSLSYHGHPTPRRTPRTEPNIHSRASQAFIFPSYYLLASKFAPVHLPRFPNHGAALNLTPLFDVFFIILLSLCTEISVTRQKAELFYSFEAYMPRSLHLGVLECSIHFPKKGEGEISGLASCRKTCPPSSSLLLCVIFRDYFPWSCGAFHREVLRKVYHCHATYPLFEPRGSCQERDGYGEAGRSGRAKIYASIPWHPPLFFAQHILPVSQ